MIRTHFEARKARMRLAEIQRKLADERLQLQLFEDRLATQRRLAGLEQIAADTLADLQAYEDRVKDTRRRRRGPV